MSSPKTGFLTWMAYTALVAVCSSGVAAASPTIPFSLPDEIEAVGGMGAAQSHAGVAVSSDLSALSLNPAMLFKNQHYEVGGSYFWPSLGRPFYKVGVIDGVTSSTVAAFEYTGFQDKAEVGSERLVIDSSVLKRGSVGVAVPTEYVSLGIAAHYVEADDPQQLDSGRRLKGFTLGVGLAAFLTEEVRVGASVQNLNGKDLAAVAPKIIRAGVAWEDKQGNLLMGLEYKQRDRSLYFELPEDDELLALAQDLQVDFEKPEKTILGNVQVRTFDVVKIFASYGQEIGELKRKQAGAGLGLFHRTFSLAYSLHKNLSSDAELQSSLNLSLFMKI